MSKFKVGDKVVINHPVSGAKTGTIMTVNRVDYDNFHSQFFYSIDGASFGVLFEKSLSHTPEFLPMTDTDTLTYDGVNYVAKKQTTSTQELVWVYFSDRNVRVGYVTRKLQLEGNCTSVATTPGNIDSVIKWDTGWTWRAEYKTTTTDDGPLEWVPVYE